MTIRTQQPLENKPTVPGRNPPIPAFRQQKSTFCCPIHPTKPNFRNPSASSAPLNAGTPGLHLRARLLALAIAVPSLIVAQTPPSLTITLADAISRAHQYGAQVQSAALNTALAAEDTKQAKANRLPTLNAFNQFIYTQGDHTPSGAFVANDGVHVYNEQAVVHQELLNAIRKGEVNRALAAEAVARARTDLIARGLDFTVIQNYYAIVSAQRKAVNVQTALDEAQHFLDITQKQEAGGEVARADVVKARISVQQSQRAVQDAQLAIEKARIALAVFIFPDFRTSTFTIGCIRA